MRATPSTSNTDSSPINETADIFAPTLTLEETNTQKGYEDGFNAGFSLGIQEGYQVGLKHGFQVGEELGFYRGLVNVWSSAIRVDPDFLSVRIRRMVQRMLELLDKYPMLDPGNEGVDEIKTGLRLKFRAVCASLGVKLEYDGFPRLADAHDSEF